MGELDNMLEEENEQRVQRKQHIEISCPMFLRPFMKQILSVGKSIKIIRYLEENQQVKNCKNDKANGMQIIERMDNKVAAKAQSLDHQGLDYEKLSRVNVKIMQKAGSDFTNFDRDRPSFEIETIANSITEAKALI
jgi:hypothetical protein